MRRFVGLVAALAVAGGLTACAPAVPRTGTASAPAATGVADFLVFYADGAQDAARAAIQRAGGTALGAEPKLGYLLASGPGDAFVDALDGDPAVAGVTGDRLIGAVTAARWTGTEAARPATAGRTVMPDVSGMAGAAAEPLAKRQWDMRMIGADRANTRAPGTKKVLVGVIDTGVDGKHPDLAPNFNRALSRNFVTDIPKDREGQEVDGACEVKSCKDPADVDDDGHGTHVASTIASPINGVGIAGVAPGVQIVNIRAGQDSGFFFLKPSLDALTYAADIGVDVVNMSFYIDPWLFNCTANKSDSKKQRQQQRAVRTGMQRALDYAHAKGVTLISALGNESMDLGRPTVDTASPNYPRGSERTRGIDNSCLNLPAEGKHVISVSALDPAGRKASYSNYGLEQADLSAPGGDGGGLSTTRSILAAAPENALRADRKLDSSGEPTTSEVIRDCTPGDCSYYQYLDGTSMAAPHATGVAAILISRFGKPGKGGVRMDPGKVAKLLYATATPKACPAVRACEGGKSRNGFYGRGVVDALKAATVKP
ncbi:S8 family serine peptidase [Nonomuraea sp. NPDC050310]|uniref:S8 family peptidase n=1 Tax=Nonomuraea sp. NPDC050310 TaxID=3154935 RepID=UPI0033CFA118